MNVWLAAAALLTGVITFLHIFAGGARAASPLLKSTDLDFEAKYTNYYCWHLVSLTLAAMAAAFGYAAIHPSAEELAVFAVGLAAAFTLASLVLIASLDDRRGLTELPQWTLFLSVTIIAAIGLL